MYFRDISDTDVVTSELAGEVRDYRVNGKSGVWWKKGEWPSFGEKYEAKAFLAARDTSRPEDERARLAAEYWEKAVSHAAHHGLPAPVPVPLPTAGAEVDGGPDAEQMAAVQNLVNSQFGGDFTQALLAVGRQGDIAVTWMDRDRFAQDFAERDVDLTDELWARITPRLKDFDDYAIDPGTSLQSDYADETLRQLGLSGSDEDASDTETR